MPEPFLSSDEYDERAHQLYNEGRYDEAIDLLRDGLRLYPDTVELEVGMGYARLAREEFAWARRAFESALLDDPDNEEARAGLGEVLLRLGERNAALSCFDRVLAMGFEEDLDLVLQMGRALFREGMLEPARRYFELAAGGHPDSAEAAACVGYAAHRLAQEDDALTWLRRALAVEPKHAEARIYLANLLYDRGEYEEALGAFEATHPEDHWDELGVWRVLELKKSVYRLADDDPELKPWLVRLADLAGEEDATDALLAELEAAGPGGTGGRDPAQLELFSTLLTELQEMHKHSRGGEVHRVATREGLHYIGTWDELVIGMRDRDAASVGRPVEEFLARAAARGTALTGVAIPATDAESFLRGCAEAGLLRIVR
jgi:tetratricopeptide (TPR) repeat protein